MSRGETPFSEKDIADMSGEQEKYLEINKDAVQQEEQIIAKDDKKEQAVLKQEKANSQETETEKEISIEQKNEKEKRSDSSEEKTEIENLPKEEDAEEQVKKEARKKFFSKDYFFGAKNSNYDDYDKFAGSPEFWEPILKVVDKYKIPKGNALDVGCALGYLLKNLKPNFKELHGLDISNFALDKAKQNIPEAELRQGDINTDELPYPDKYFDLVTALEVLEHTESIEKSLNKIVPKLKDDGHLIVSLPIKDTWVRKIFQYLDKDASHINIPTTEELMEAFDKTKLQVVERNDYLYIPQLKKYIKGIPYSVEFVLKKIN